MPRNNILEGTNLTDVATGEVHSVDAGTFNYYGYSKPDGSWVILREKDDESEYRFDIGSANQGDDYPTAYTDRQNRTYKRADQFNVG